MISELRVGAWRVALAPLGRALWDPRLVDAREIDRVEISFNACVAIGPDRVVIVDPGLDDAASAWGREHEARWQGVVRFHDLHDVLRALDLREDDVDVVLLTHAHPDHLAAITRDTPRGRRARFPRARHLMGAEDRVSARYDGVVMTDVEERLSIVEAAGQLELVTADEIAIAPGWSFARAPGESPGHRVATLIDEGAVLFAGDLVHLPIEIERPSLDPFGRDGAAIAESRARWFRWAIEERAHVVLFHAPAPGLGRIERAAKGARWASG